MGPIFHEVLGHRVAAVVFDCDGVLCDTEPLSQRAWSEVVSRLGGHVTSEDFSSLVGGTERQVAERYAAELGLPADRLEHEGRAALVAILGQGVRVFPDAARLLDRLTSRSVPVAVASNSFRWRLDAVLSAAGLADRVPVVVAGDEVSRPKPAPDVYLESARRLGVPPGGCLVVEDSPTGIAAARAAGMRVVAVDRGIFTPELLAPADRIVPRLSAGPEAEAPPG